MTAVNVSLVAIAVWLALNTLCLAIWLLRTLLRRTSGLRKTEEAGPVTDQRSPLQLQLFDELPLRAETAPTKPTSWDSSLVPSCCSLRGPASMVTNSPALRSIGRDQRCRRLQL